MCSPCCHLTTDTEVSAAVPADYRAASFLRLGDYGTHPQHSLFQNRCKTKDSNIVSYFKTLQVKKTTTNVHLSLSDYIGMSLEINQYGSLSEGSPPDSANHYSISPALSTLYISLEIMPRLTCHRCDKTFIHLQCLKTFYRQYSAVYDRQVKCFQSF